MSSHASVEALSAYLDQELSAAQAHQVEEHLTNCETCQIRFSGMRKVVSSLKHLERMAPPSSLGQVVARRVALEGEHEGLIDRLEGNLGIFERQSSLLGLFGLIVALAMIILMFAHALENRSQSTIPVIFQDPETLVRSTENALEQRELAGFVFHRRDGDWVEKEASPPATRTESYGSATWAALLTNHPTLSELEESQRPTVMKIGNDVVRFIPAGETSTPP